MNNVGAQLAAPYSNRLVDDQRFNNALTPIPIPQFPL